MISIKAAFAAGSHYQFYQQQERYQHLLDGTSRYTIRMLTGFFGCPTTFSERIKQGAGINYTLDNDTSPFIHTLFVER